MASALPADLVEGVLSADEAHLKCAREDPNAFAEYVLKDEYTGLMVQQSPTHVSWQDLASTRSRLLIWSHIESGKTTQLAVARTLYELGVNPNIRIAIVSNTRDQAAKIVRSIQKYIEQSAELRRVFPKMVPDEPWTSYSLSIQRESVAKDPSVQACGIHGNITGSRIDLLILDDILDFENCRTPLLRQDLEDWYRSALAGRLTKDSRVFCIGTAYHPDDLLHRFARSGAWASFRYPVIDPDTGTPRWPDRWPPHRIEAKKAELGPLEFARQMLCLARNDEEARFDKKDIDACIERGKGKDVAEYLNGYLAPGYRLYSGCDIGVQRHAAAGRTVIFTIAIHPNEDRQVIYIESGKWSGPEIVKRIIGTHSRYGSIVVVENNAAQDFILQFASAGSAVPIQPFTTGKNKADPSFGIESLSVELSNKKWIIPAGADGKLHPEIAEWITEMLYYDPKAHTGDRLMASWFAREGARMGTVKAETGRLDLKSR